MSGYVVDTSALISILLAEPDADQFSNFLDRNALACISAATLHEAFCVMTRHGIAHGAKRLEAMIDLIAPDIVAFDTRQLEVAKSTYARYGRGTGHRANLNMGDCFSYALAKTQNLPLLFKGDDFIHTDIESALKAV